MNETRPTSDKLAEFARVLEAALRDRYRKLFNDSKHTPEVYQSLEDGACKVRVTPGPKYTKVDVASGSSYYSGRYMVENETGVIYGIKGYGKVHKGHVFGTLDTLADWDWGHYRALRIR